MKTFKVSRSGYVSYLQSQLGSQDTPQAEADLEALITKIQDSNISSIPVVIDEEEWQMQLD